MNISLRNFTRSIGALLASAAIGASLLLAAAPPLSAHEFEVGAIEIGHPWSRAVPRGAKVAAGYLTLSNEGASADRLVAATADIAGRVEFHEMAMDSNGVMTMRRLADGLEIPAGGTVALEPGSIHMMFLDLKAAPERGKPFKGTLIFEKAGTVAVEYAVEAIGGETDGHEHEGGDG